MYQMDDVHCALTITRKIYQNDKEKVLENHLKILKIIMGHYWTVKNSNPEPSKRYGEKTAKIRDCSTILRTKNETSEKRLHSKANCQWSNERRAKKTETVLRRSGETERSINDQLLQCLELLLSLTSIFWKF